MKGEGKTFMKSKIKWVGLVGLVLSVLSLFVHFLLARFSEQGIADYQASITIFSWRPIFETADFTKPFFIIFYTLYRRLWSPVMHLESLYPDARGTYADPSPQSNGFVFVRIQGGFHEIRNSICDVVAVARLLNATLVIPEIQSITSTKGISSQFKSFAYLYNEDHFVAALTKDVKVVKTLPKHLKGSRRKKEIPSFRVQTSASPYFYMHNVLPVLSKHSVVELVVSDGGCLQAILPSTLEEYQRLRCRVAFHALRFRQEVQELATKILLRLRAPGRPFIAYDPGMSRDALAYYGCAELFQDVHAELIQHKRAWMIKRGIVKGNQVTDSIKRRLNGSCPFLPEEVGILLRAYGYPWDTIMYVSGGEVFGGQRTLIPLHAMFENVVDRTSLSAEWELSRIYGREVNLADKYSSGPPSDVEERKPDSWRTAGQRPRPLPPPPARPKSYNVEGWWGWVAESDDEPESTVMELRTNAHKLLWEAIDYVICVEADVFFPGFDRDGKGHPNFASLVMGHRLYESAVFKTFRPDRRVLAKLLEENREHLYQANQTWLTSVRRHLRKSLIDGLGQASANSKPKSFLSHPVPECSCLRHDRPETSLNASSSLTKAQLDAVLGVKHQCPTWMDSKRMRRSINKENEEDLDEDVSSSSGLFSMNDSVEEESGSGETNKEDSQLEDTEDAEGME